MQLSLFANPDLRTVTSLTLNVALAIGSTEFFNQIERFAKEATECEYTNFTHLDYFYSYPEFGKTWKNNKHCEFHRVNTKCHLCDWRPARNYAGYGSIYILNNGICNSEILYRDASKKLQWIKNTPRLSRMILLCPKHIAGYFRWEK